MDTALQQQVPAVILKSAARHWQLAVDRILKDFSAQIHICDIQSPEIHSHSLPALQLR